MERIELGRFEMETWYFSPLPPEFKDCKVSQICIWPYVILKSIYLGSGCSHQARSGMLGVIQVHSQAAACLALALVCILHVYKPHVCT